MLNKTFYMTAILYNEYVNNICDFLEDFEQLYNGGVTNETILEKCREVEKKSE